MADKVFEDNCARIHCPFCRGILDEHTNWRTLVGEYYTFPKICPFGVTKETAKAAMDAIKVDVREECNLNNCQYAEDGERIKQQDGTYLRYWQCLHKEGVKDMPTGGWDITHCLRECLYYSLPKEEPAP